MVSALPWLVDDFCYPERVDLPTGHHLRPIRESDVDIDYPAVMTSRERLWARYGAMWGWPQADMTYDFDREDLARHEREIAAHVTFNYAVLDEYETELFGCVYIDPPGDTLPTAPTPSSRGGCSIERPAGSSSARWTSSSRAG